MGSAQQPSKVKLFLAILFRPEIEREGLLREITAFFGAVEFSHGPVPFTFSDYYRDEMGEGLLKRYMTFAPLVDRERLPGIKAVTNGIERSRLANGGRTVNLDPGYIARDKLVLATTKDFYHRLYLSEGIYGEVTLHFRKGAFRHFSWTYPDYKEASFQEFLMKARATYMHETREGRPAPP